MERRHLRDEQGRIWVGNVGSGRLRGGEEHAEVTFICRDQPSELKRFTRLDVEASRADEVWREMGEDQLMEVFRRSEPV